MMSDEEREEKELDLTSPEVVTKYKSAAEIANSNSLSLSLLSLCNSDNRVLFLLMFILKIGLCFVKTSLLSDQMGYSCRGIAVGDIGMQTKDEDC